MGVFGMVAQAVIHGVDIVDYMVARSRSLDFATFHQVVDGGSGLPLRCSWSCSLVVRFRYRVDDGRPVAGV